MKAISSLAALSICVGMAGAALAQEQAKPDAATPEVAATAGTARTGNRAAYGRILALALPTFGQLIAEPTFVLIDTAIVGQWNRRYRMMGFDMESAFATGLHVPAARPCIR